MSISWRSASSPLLAALAIVLLSFSLTACSSTQEAASSDSDRVTQMLTSIDEAVGLTNSQAVQIRDILAAQEANRPSGPPPGGGQGGQAGPPRGQGGGGQGGDRDAARAEVERKIEAVLTETQVTAYREWRASQPQRSQGPPPGRQ